MWQGDLSWWRKLDLVLTLSLAVVGDKEVFIVLFWPVPGFLLLSSLSGRKCSIDGTAWLLHWFQKRSVSIEGNSGSREISGYQLGMSSKNWVMLEELVGWDKWGWSHLFWICWVEKVESSITCGRYQQIYLEEAPGWNQMSRSWGMTRAEVFRDMKVCEIYWDEVDLGENCRLERSDGKSIGGMNLKTQVWMKGRWKEIRGITEERCGLGSLGVEREKV